MSDHVTTCSTPIDLFRVESRLTTALAAHVVYRGERGTSYFPRRLVIGVVENLLGALDDERRQVRAVELVDAGRAYAQAMGDPGPVSSEDLAHLHQILYRLAQEAAHEQVAAMAALFRDAAAGGSW